MPRSSSRWPRAWDDPYQELWGGVSDIFQALTLVFGGTSVVGLRHAVSKLENSSVVGLRHAVADDSRPATRSGNPLTAREFFNIRRPDRPFGQFTR